MKKEDEIDDLFEQYLKTFPSESDVLPLLINANGLTGAIDVLKIAVARGKKIDFGTESGTDATTTTIAGEVIVRETV